MINLPAPKLLNFGTLLCSITCLLLIRFVFHKRRIPKGLRLPPGPPKKFVVGNLSDVPTYHPWEVVTKWGKTYGGLVHLRILNTNMVFVNSAEIAHELFDVRSLVYSDRAPSPMINELMGAAWIFTFMSYGERWRRHRKYFNKSFGQTAVTQFCDVQAKQTMNFLKRLHRSPDKFISHIRHLSGAIIMEATYGIHILAENDPFVQTAEDAMAAFSETLNSWGSIVDIFPILKYAPAWMPGAEFQRKARAWRVPIAASATAPYEKVKQNMAAGIAEPSFLSTLLEELASKSDAPPDEEKVIRDTAAVAYLGGSDTTTSTLTYFFLAMITNPEVQRRAQEELDAILGNRLPTFEDRKDLPYIDGLCKELFRLYPVAPLGIPHRTNRDDVYGDFWIPKGSMVVGNIWGILRDERFFGEEPDKLIPERYAKPGMNDPSIVFGFGRRICPGLFMALNSIFIVVASVLKVFNISRAKDSQGNEIPVKEVHVGFGLIHPEPFRCAIKLRPGSEVLIDSSD